MNMHYRDASYYCTFTHFICINYLIICNWTIGWTVKSDFVFGELLYNFFLKTRKRRRKRFHKIILCGFRSSRQCFSTRTISLWKIGRRILPSDVFPLRTRLKKTDNNWKKNAVGESSNESITRSGTTPTRSVICERYWRSAWTLDENGLETKRRWPNSWANVSPSDFVRPMSSLHRLARVNGSRRPVSGHRGDSLDYQRT